MTEEEKKKGIFMRLNLSPGKLFHSFRAASLKQIVGPKLIVDLILHICQVRENVKKVNGLLGL